MKVLSISSDKKIFEEGSAVARRMAEYGALAQELHIIVFTPKGHKKIELARNVWAYPTDSKTKLHYVFDAIRIGKQVARNWELNIKNSRDKNEILVTAQDPFESGLVGWRIARACGARLQIQIHTDLFAPGFSRGNLLNKVRLIITHFLIPKTDCIRAVSERIKRSLIAQFPRRDMEEKTAVLPIYVDTNAIRVNTERATSSNKTYPQFDTRVLVVSRLEREKDIKLVLDAMAGIVSTHPKTGLIIVGEGKEEAALRARATRLGIEHNVIFAGWQGDLAPYYASADIFLQTSQYEGYGMALIEAVASGLPAVSTDVGIASELLTGENSAFLCTPDDKECVARAVKVLVEDTDRRKKCARDLARMLPHATVATKDLFLTRIRDGWEKCGVNTSQA